MLNFLTGGLTRRMVLVFLLLGILTTGLVGYLSYRSAQDALTEFVFREIEADRNLAAEAAVQYTSAIPADMMMLLQSEAVRAACDVLSFQLDSAGAQTGGAVSHTESREYKVVVYQVEPILGPWLAQNESAKCYRDLIIIVGRDKGMIGYTQKKLSDLGQTLTRGHLKDSHLAKLWRRVSETMKPAMVDFGPYEPAGELSAFLGLPILAEGKDKLAGVLVVRIGPEKIQSILRSSATRWTSGRAYLVGQDFGVRSFAQAGKESAKPRALDIEASRAALAGNAGTAVLADEDHEPVLCSWATLGLKNRESLGADFDWGIVSSMDTSEALAPVRGVRNRVMTIGALVVTIVCMLAWLIARSIARPVVTLALQADQVGRGNLTVEIPDLNKRDEVGFLADSFARMVRGLREQLRQMQGAVAVLSATAKEITSAVIEIAGATRETSSAVTETATTVEQVKQASRLASETAMNVAARSQQTVIVSQAGMQATDDTVAGIKRISEQMNSIGETVVRLSEISRSIENIIKWMKDLADQSNLLAVNASIEASRAGEHGRGFSIVAQEIKSLADQSKEASNQVNAILHGSYKWITEVVMATEQGTKAVQVGVQQSEIAGDALKTLAESVQAAAQAAQVIDAASKQQLGGVEQVSLAMSHTKDSVERILQGIEKLEASVRGLEELGRSLQQLVLEYRLEA